MFVCPVAYSSRVIEDKLVKDLGADLGEKLFLLYSLNPMVGVIDGFRWAILGVARDFNWQGFVLSLGLTLLLLILGVIYFRKTERSFADTI